MPPRQQTDARSSLRCMEQGNSSLAAMKNWCNLNYKHDNFRGKGVSSWKKKNHQLAAGYFLSSA